MPTSSSPTHDLSARPATDHDVAAIVALWAASDLTRPHNHAPTDIAFARTGQHSDVLVLEDNGQIIASVMVGHDGHRGWIYYLAVDPSRRRQGLGRNLMMEAERWLTAQGVWKYQLMVRRSNTAVGNFYESLGFNDDDVVVLSKCLKAMPYIDPEAPQ